jgi:hypothetical protein
MINRWTNTIRAVCFPITPSLVNTDLTNNLVKGGSYKLPPDMVAHSVDDAVEHLLARIDEGTREQNGFINWDRQVIPW